MANKVLLVDDDPVIRMLVCDCLTAYGYSVDQATCGTECLEMLAKSKPQLIILDLIMPDITGLDVLQKIRSQDDLNGIPVILLSADPDVQMNAAERNLSADKYLQKPFNIYTIVDAVKSVTAEAATRG